ncbi:MAG: VanZ family protein [Chitinophagaceae bacterium]|nr:VanZ family protein [Chitinophagaceae bacterium]
MPLSKRLHLLLAIILLAGITILLVIPGSAFPSENWMSSIQLDKWIHIFLFAILVIMWVTAMWKNYPTVTSFHKLSVSVACIAVIYGISMEIVQHYFVTNRSFELNDIFADLAGSLIGYLLLMSRYIKK